MASGIDRTVWGTEVPDEGPFGSERDGDDVRRVLAGSPEERGSGVCDSVRRHTCLVVPPRETRVSSGRAGEGDGETEVKRLVG